MATYIQGQADYISQIQPTEPNLAFDAQILQQKQAKYDANHKKVSELYGSLLNSSLTRSDNIQARDEFFQIINDDIRRMGGIDFSLDQNVQAAASVFQSIYTNDNIVKDMVWTKNYNNEVNRAEAFKNCIDEEKCGGSYWEEGERYMQYKRMEFKNATADQALGMADVRYIPNKNVMKQAIKLAKDAGLNVEIDQISGDYKVTTKNGELLKSPLTSLFSETIGKDPAFADMFKAKAYVDRNDWAMSKVNMGEYGDMNQAQLGYLQNVNKQNKAKIDQAAEDLSIDVGHLDQKVKDMELAYGRGEFKEGSDLYKQYAQLVQLQSSAKQAKSFTDQIQKVSSMKNNQMAIESLAENVDNQNAYRYFNEEINTAVQTLAYKDAKQTMEADEFAVMKYEHKYKVSEMALQHQYDVKEEQLAFDNKLKLEDYRKQLGHSSYADKSSGTGSITASDNYIQKKNEAETYGNAIQEMYGVEMKNMFGGDIPKQSDVATWKKAYESNGDETQVSKYKEYLKAKASADSKYLKLQRDANEAAVKFGKIPQYRNVLTVTDIETFNGEYDWDYETAWASNSAKYLKKDFPKMTNNDFNAAVAAADKTKPLYPQLESYLNAKY
jgi:hypothetical protein